MNEALRAAVHADLAARAQRVLERTRRQLGRPAPRWWVDAPVHVPPRWPYLRAAVENARLTSQDVDADSSPYVK